MRVHRVFSSLLLVALAVGPGGCGNPNATFLNDSFINFVSGGVVPLTPGPNAAFVMVRAVNSTSDTPIEFVVTIEKTQLARDEEGRPQVDDAGAPITERVLETVRLQTFADDQANELGHVFPCGDAIIERVGLGDNLLPTDQGLFLNSIAADQPGFGVPAGIPPLVSALGNFACGDTIIFRAIRATGVPGGVKVQSFRLDFTQQPNQFSGPDTFNNLEAVLEMQQVEQP